MKEDILVSIVITTKNEERNLENCLKSIVHQTYKNIEIIVVDNFSTDQTENIARKYTENFFSKGPERSAQRNFGMITKAKGSYVIYIDADMLLSPTLIESCVDFVSEMKCSALHISEFVLGKNFFSQVRRFERGFYDGTAIDGARFFNRNDFTRVGGFDEELFKKGSGEDWDIDKLIKKQGPILLLPQQGPISPPPWNSETADFLASRGADNLQNFIGIYHNESEFSLGAYLKKKSYYALGFDGYINKWGKNDPDIKNQFGLWYRFLGVFIENGKWKRVIRHPLLTLGMYFLRFLVGLVFISRKFR